MMPGFCFINAACGICIDFEGNDISKEIGDLHEFCKRLGLDVTGDVFYRIESVYVSYPVLFGERR